MIFIMNDEWYHNSCTGFQPSFTYSAPLFVCIYCIDSRFYHFIPFLSLMFCDTSDTKYVSIKQCFNEFLTMSYALKIRLTYRKFLSLYQQNQNKKLIYKVKILSTKGISNQYLNCYISGAL